MSQVVLIVDDEPLLREILRDYLEAAQFEVVEAENAHQALDLIKSQNIHCVVSDIRMPGGSGIDLAQGLFALAKPKPKLILMTGYSDFSWEQAQALDVLKILPKPFEPDVIIKEVKQALN